MITLATTFTDIWAWGVLLGLYFLPTLIAAIRGHQVASVAVLNLFLGWTFIGWVVALVMAVRDKPRGRQQPVRP